MSQNADESDLKEDFPSQLRDSLRCQILLKLVLRLPRLTVIPRTVFEHMPLLEVLDLSSSSIQSLPSSVSSLSSLKELLLRDCSFLIELPIEIGMLTKLKLLDIEGSEIMYIPKEIVELTDLEVLRLCLSQYAEYYIKAKNVNGGVIVPRMMISKLKKLKELCISVCQEAEWWEKEIKQIQDEICHLENLEFLKWYLPTDTTLKQFLDIQINRKPAYEKLSNFTFTIGQHAQLTSCLPRGLEKKFTEFENCLKWINAEGNIYDISKIMTRAKALFLSRHWTIVNLSAFDISKLKYFLLAECNEMETLVKIDDLSEIVENNKKNGLESLEYLSIHYMEKLKSIWEGPVSKDSLSRLRILALHTCLELTTIFTPIIAQNLSCLAELTVEECPKVRSLIINPHSEHGPLFPSLERIFLIDLPELDHIFGGLIVLEKVESLMIYNCVKLRRLSEMELPRIQKIKGENKWWNSLTAYEPTWENVFEPLKENSELIKQLLEATNSLQHFHDVVSREAKDEKPLDGPVMGAQETKIEPFNFPLRKEEGRFHTLPDDLLMEASESFANGHSMLSTSRSEVHQESEVFKRNSEKKPTQGQSFSPNANLSRNNEKTPLVLVKQRRERKSIDTRVEVSNTIEDCYQWRKYGEKEFLNSFPRCYYRCTHMNNQGCKAKKHVQQLEDESNKFRITYSGYHTCTITPHNDLIVPHHGPEVVLSFEGSNNQQSLTTNNDDHVSVSVDDLLTEASESFANGLSMLSTSRSEVHQESEVFKRNSEKTPTQGQSFSPNANLSRNNEKTPLVLVKQGRERKSRDTRVEVSDTIVDCYQWRKYGQKEILNSKFPRCYYRCTHRYNLGCMATKQVQQLEDESNKFHITYSGDHTCTITSHNDLIVPHHGPEVDLSFEGSTNQQSLPTNNSTTKKIGDKPSRKRKYHANATSGSDQGSSHSVMSADLLDVISDGLLDMDFLENEDFLSE